MVEEEGMIVWPSEFKDNLAYKCEVVNLIILCVYSLRL